MTVDLFGLPSIPPPSEPVLREEPLLGSCCSSLFSIRLEINLPGGVDPPKITFVSLAAVAERAHSLQRTAPSWRTEVPCSGSRRFTDRVLAHVRTPGGPTGPAQPLLRLTRSPSTSCS